MLPRWVTPALLQHPSLGVPGAPWARKFPDPTLRGRGHIAQAQPRNRFPGWVFSPGRGRRRFPAPRALSGQWEFQATERMRKQSSGSALLKKISEQTPRGNTAHPSLSKSWSSGLGCTSNPRSRPTSQLSPLGYSGCKPRGDQTTHGQPKEQSHHRPRGPPSLRAVQTCQNRALARPEHPRGVFGKGELIQTGFDHPWERGEVSVRAGAAQIPFCMGLTQIASADDVVALPARGGDKPKEERAGKSAVHSSRADRPWERDD